MLILSQDGITLFDTRGGATISVEENDYDMWLLLGRGADTTGLGEYKSKEDAKAALRELYTAAARGDMVEELQ